MWIKQVHLQKNNSKIKHGELLNVSPEIQKSKIILLLWNIWNLP